MKFVTSAVTASITVQYNTLCSPLDYHFKPFVSQQNGRFVVDGFEFQLLKCGKQKCWPFCLNVYFIIC